MFRPANQYQPYRVFLALLPSVFLSSFYNSQNKIPTISAFTLNCKRYRGLRIKKLFHRCKRTRGVHFMISCRPLVSSLLLLQLPKGCPIARLFLSFVLCQHYQPLCQMMSACHWIPSELHDAWQHTQNVSRALPLERVSMIEYLSAQLRQRADKSHCWNVYNIAVQQRGGLISISHLDSYLVSFISLGSQDCRICYC